MIIDKLPRQIILGYQNEHNVNNIVIDCSAPATGPKAEILMEDQLHDGATIWIDQGSRAIKAQGLTVGSRYLFNIVGFFIK